MPDRDTFQGVFERIAPEALSEGLCDWLGCHRKEDPAIVVGGKTICGSKMDGHKVYHAVSVFAADAMS